MEHIKNQHEAYDTRGAKARIASYRREDVTQGVRPHEGWEEEKGVRGGRDMQASACGPESPVDGEALRYYCRRACALPSFPW